jgi:hypothetical protein
MRAHCNFVVSGIIVLVQEQRFQLVDEEGRAHLLVLAHDLSLRPSDLRSLQRSQRTVRVEYRAVDDVFAKLATRLEQVKEARE